MAKKSRIYICTDMKFRSESKDNLAKSNCCLRFIVGLLKSIYIQVQEVQERIKTRLQIHFTIAVKDPVIEGLFT